MSRLNMLLDRWMIEVVHSDDPRSGLQSSSKICKEATLHSTFPIHSGIPFQPSWNGFLFLSTPETSYLIRSLPVRKMPGDLLWGKILLNLIANIPTHDAQDRHAPKEGRFRSANSLIEALTNTVYRWSTYLPLPASSARDIQSFSMDKYRGPASPSQANIFIAGFNASLYPNDPWGIYNKLAEYGHVEKRSVQGGQQPTCTLFPIRRLSRLQTPLMNGTLMSVGCLGMPDDVLAELRYRSTGEPLLLEHSARIDFAPTREY